MPGVWFWIHETWTEDLTFNFTEKLQVTHGLSKWEKNGWVSISVPVLETAPQAYSPQEENLSNFVQFFARPGWKQPLLGTLSGFRASGIWPLNMAEIPDTAYVGDRLVKCEASSTNTGHNTIPSTSNAQRDQPSIKIPSDIECSTEHSSSPWTSASPGSRRLHDRGDPASSSRALL